MIRTKQQLKTQQLIVFTGCCVALLTLCALFACCKYKPSLSQLVCTDIGYNLFTVGFGIVAICHLVIYKTWSIGALLMTVVVFNVYDYPVIHNIAAFGFFALYTISMWESKSLFYLFIAAWFLLYFNMLAFEIIGISLIVINNLKVNRII